MPVRHTPPQPWTGRSDPEDGDLALRPHHLVQDKAPCALIGFACDAGVVRNKGRAGAREGPSALRRALANISAPSNASRFTDLGDVEVSGDDLEDGQLLLTQTIAAALPDHDRIVVMGGGHETAFGSYCGIERAYPDSKIGIINLDAHLDLRLPGKNGPSSGTPFTQIRERDPDNFDYLCLGIAEEANTAALMQRAHDWGVQTVPDQSLIADPRSADAAIDAIIKRSDVIYLTICLDALPHYQAPGVSAPAARGIPLAATEYLIGYISDQCDTCDCKIPLADVVELSPPHDINDMTAKSAALLVRQILFS